jgi:hypothetical protein
MRAHRRGTQSSTPLSAGGMQVQRGFEWDRQKTRSAECRVLNAEGEVPRAECRGRNAPGYLITPRSDASINRISISTSSPRSGSDFSLSSAWDVFSFEASRIL